MRFRITPVVILATVLLASMPAAVSAQPPLQRDTWLLSGALGLAVDGDGNSSLTLSGAAAFPLTSQIAVEGELGHVFDISPDTVNVDTRLTTVHGSVLYFFNTPYVLTPYAAAGLGVGKYSIDAPPIDFGTTELGFNFGGGVTYPIGGSTFVRGDVRIFKHIDDVPTIWRFTGGVSVRIGT